MTLLESFIALDTLNLLALLGVVFIGLPHGAMDGALAVHFGWMGRPTRAIAFLLAYVGLAGLVVLTWAIAPVLSFITFLAISTYHFGRGDATSSIVGRGAVESIARGGVVIGGISQFHRAEANDVFLTIVGADTTGVWLFLDGLVVLAAACIFETMLFKQQQERTAFGLELGALSLLFVAVPPLVGFAVYFCFVHSLPALFLHAFCPSVHGLKSSNHSDNGGVFPAHMGRWTRGLGSAICGNWRRTSPLESGLHRLGCLDRASHVARRRPGGDGPPTIAFNRPRLNAWQPCSRPLVVP